MPLSSSLSLSGSGLERHYLEDTPPCQDINYLLIGRIWGYIFMCIEFMDLYYKCYNSKFILLQSW